MNVHCSTCGEPWDVYHLRHEAIFETDLDNTEVQAWARLPRNERLGPRFREKFKEAGYEFGASILDVRRCPCCPKNAQPNINKEEIKSALTKLLGNDEDGLAAMLEDFGL